MLIVPSLNQAFIDELAVLRCSLRPLGGGYAEVVGFPYSIYVVCTDEVAETEQDDFLRIYSHHTVQTEAARQWLEAFILRKQSAMPNVNEREDYREMLGKLLASVPAEERLAGIPARERLAGIPVRDRIADLPAEEVLALYRPEERIAGLEPEEVLPLLPVELLRMLPEDALRGLPEEVQQAIRRRLAGSK